MSRVTRTLTACLVVGLAAIPARAQCEPETFESFAVGTIISNQIPGVAIFAYPGSCGGGSPDTWIVAPSGGTASGSKALGLQTGCPDFSPDFIVLDFDELQHLVTFCLGEQAGQTGHQVRVRAYSSAGGLVSNQLITTGSGTRAFVRVGSESGPSNIRWIEIEEMIGLFETIDDLHFDMDSTPPTAQIDEPSFVSCVCASITVTGIACDSDGEYGGDRLEYRAVAAEPDDPWILVGSYTTPVCEPGSLYNWDASAVVEGHYYLRLTVENACGMIATDVTTVRVDDSAPHVSISLPVAGATVCGEVEVRGISNDYDSCDGDWELGVAPTGSSDYVTIAEGVGDVSCTLTVWDTTTVDDGSYTLRLLGTNMCGMSAQTFRTVTVDNSDGCGCTADINGDGQVDVGDLLILLASWG